MNMAALALAALASLLVLATPWALWPGVRVRTRTGVHRVSLPPATWPPRRSWLHRQLSSYLLPRPLALLAQVLVLDAQGPGARALRWRLVRAGEGQRPLAWVRRRQLAVASLFALFALLTLLSAVTGLLPAPALPVLLLLCAAAGVALPLVDLAYRARTRRERLRHELVDLLYALATLVGAGLTLESSLYEVVSTDGELAAELRAVLNLRGVGVSLDETLDLLAERCATAAVTGALRRMTTARGSGARMAPTLREMAEATQRDLREERRVQKARALLTTTALLALTGLPPLLVALLYPIAVAALQGGS